MGPPIRFYTDEHVSKAVIRALRRRGVNVLTAPEAGLLGAGDDIHLEKARVEGRVLFSQDDNFLRLHATGAAHGGIVYAPQGTSIGAQVRGLMLVFQVLSADDMIGSLEYI